MIQGLDTTLKSTSSMDQTSRLALQLGIASITSRSVIRIKDGATIHRVISGTIQEAKDPYMESRLVLGVSLVFTLT